MTGPELSVVVPSHERPLRLRWLLNALEEQSLRRKRFEVVVAHDSGPATHEVLAGHPLARTGMLREIRVSPLQAHAQAPPRLAGRPGAIDAVEVAAMLVWQRPQPDAAPLSTAVPVDAVAMLAGSARDRTLLL